MTSFFTLLMLILFVRSLYQLFRVLKTRTLIIWHMVFTLIQYTISIMVLEGGSYSYELGTSTYNVGSAWKLILYHIIYIKLVTFFATMFPLARVKENARFKGDTAKIITICLMAIAAISIFYTLADMMITGIPLFNSQLDHYNYYADFSKLPFANSMHTIATLYIPILLCFSKIDSTKKWNKILCNFFLIASVGIQILLGYKMSGLIDVILLIIMVYTLLRNVNWSRIKDLLNIKIMVSGILIVTFVLGVYANNVISNSTSSKTVAEALFTRAFSQGAHLWWVAEADNIHGNSLLPRKNKELISVIENWSPLSEKTGVTKMMVQYGVSDIVSANLRGHVRYAAHFITTSVYYFGYIFALLQIAFIAFLTSVFIFLVDTCIKNKYWFLTLFVFKIFSPFQSYVCSTGTLTTFLNYENLIILILILMILGHKTKYKLVLNKPSVRALL